LRETTQDNVIEGVFEGKKSKEEKERKRERSVSKKMCKLKKTKRISASPSRAQN